MRRRRLGCRAMRRGHRGAVVVVWRMWVRAGHPQETPSKPWTEKGPRKAPREAGDTGTGLRPRYGGQDTAGVEGQGQESR